MRIVDVNASKAYKVYIGKGIASSCAEVVKPFCKGNKALIISDSNVAPLYADKVKANLEAAGIDTCVFTIPAGEESKTPENLVKAMECCIDAELTRSDVIVSLGGGVVTDLGGLCGALYQRGINVVQMPTSLLAMVDASVGGKTAVNLNKGKNMFGAFSQPAAVICDTQMLSSLPCEEFSCGMAEVVKYAVLKGGRLSELLNLDINENIDEVVEECVKIKRDYVCADEFDKGERQFLNLGHTIGHAVERVSKLSFPHGSAVAIGMCIMARACKVLGFCDEATPLQIEALCKKYGLPISSSWDYNMLYEASLADKKRQGDKITLVMVRGMGDCFLHTVPKEFLQEIIEKGDTKE